MIVKCLANRGSELPVSDYGLEYTDRTKFPLSVNEQYHAYGIAIYRRGLVILLLNDHGLPRWYPATLFEVIDGRLPSKWKFAPRSDGDLGFQAVFGYQELVDDESHSDALMELDRDALKTFFELVEERTGKPQEELWARVMPRH